VWFQYVAAPLVVASMVAVATIVGRWITKVDRGLSVTIRTAELLNERLSGHIALDDSRHRAMERELDLLHRHA
jgi:hypothetical protein